MYCISVYTSRASLDNILQLIISNIIHGDLMTSKYFCWYLAMFLMIFTESDSRYNAEN